MKISERLRKYRLLKGITQKELGNIALKGKRDSAVRINKYEKGIIEPTPESLQILADALDVDVEALSAVDMSSNVDRIYALFDLEERRNLKITRSEGKISLEFDTKDPDEYNDTFLTYLNMWYNEHLKYRDYDEEPKEYTLWKARFFSNVRERTSEQQIKVDDTYKDIVASISEDHYKTSSDVSMLLRKIIESGLTVSTRPASEHGICFTFVIKELTEQSSPEQKALFGRFLYEFNHWKELGATAYSYVTMPNRIFLITYCINVPPFSVISCQTKNVLDFYKQTDISDYDREDFERDFKYSIKDFHINLEEEIMRYKHL